MATTTTYPTVYHEGERAVQQRAGAVEQGSQQRPRDWRHDQSRSIKFTKKQPFVVIGSIDQQQNVWASIIVGSTGFITAEPHALSIDVSQALRVHADPLWQNLTGDPRIGILVIDLRSRARLRVNGRAGFRAEDQLHVNVEQAYPNCPQYIQRRNYRPAHDQKSSSASEAGTTRLTKCNDGLPLQTQCSSRASIRRAAWTPRIVEAIPVSFKSSTRRGFAFPIMRVTGCSTRSGTSQ